MSTKYNEILRDINAGTKEVIVANSQTNSSIQCSAINLNKCFIGDNLICPQVNNLDFSPFHWFISVVVSNMNCHSDIFTFWLLQFNKCLDIKTGTAVGTITHGIHSFIKAKVWFLFNVNGIFALSNWLMDGIKTRGHTGAGAKGHGAKWEGHDVSRNTF